MRSFRWLAVSAALLGIMVAFVALALQSSSPERAIAVAATPVPWDVEWDVEALEQSDMPAAMKSIAATKKLKSPDTLGPRFAQYLLEHARDLLDYARSDRDKRQTTPPAS